MRLNSDFENGIVILGAGNVATHLSIALNNAGFSIDCIFSRTIESAKELALKVKCNYTSDLTQIPDKADLYIIAVKDEVIDKLIKQIDLKNGIVVHTAGSISIDIFEDKFKNYGVFYPLQTFSKSRKINFSGIPICVEANNKPTRNKLLSLANSLTSNVSLIDSEKRKILHLSAVFACNFVNHMYSASAEILSQSEVSFDLLKPLIIETAQKVIDNNPVKVQTGPAVRNDQNVIQKHIEMLKDNPEFEKIYRFVSDSIFNLNQKKEVRN